GLRSTYAPRGPNPNLCSASSAPLRPIALFPSASVSVLWFALSGQVGKALGRRLLVIEGRGRCGALGEALAPALAARGDRFADDDVDDEDLLVGRAAHLGDAVRGRRQAPALHALLQGALGVAHAERRGAIEELADDFAHERSRPRDASRLVDRGDQRFGRVGEDVGLLALRPERRAAPRRAHAARASAFTSALRMRVSIPSSASAWASPSSSLTHRPSTASPRNSRRWLFGTPVSFAKLACVSASSKRSMGPGPTTASMRPRSSSRAVVSRSCSFIGRSSPALARRSWGARVAGFGRVEVELAHSGRVVGRPAEPRAAPSELDVGGVIASLGQATDADRERQSRREVWERVAPPDPGARAFSGAAPFRVRAEPGVDGRVFEF